MDTRDTLHRLKNIVGLEKALQLMLKAKYYKRTGSKGNYKYYYTEDAYNKAHPKEKPSKKKITETTTETTTSKAPLKNDKNIANTIKKATPETRTEATSKITGTTDKVLTDMQALEKMLDKFPNKTTLLDKIKKFKPKNKTIILGFENIQAKDYSDYPNVGLIKVKDKDILNTPIPKYIPEVDEEMLKSNLFMPTMTPIGNDKLLVLTHEKYRSLETGDKIEDKYVILSTHQYVALHDYYYRKAKAKADEEIKKDLEPNSRFMQIAKKFNQSEKSIKLSVAQKHKVSKLAFDKMTIKSYSLIGQFTGLKTATEIWGEFRKINLKQIASDINLQSIDFESSWVKGKNTSYGDSGTNDKLLNKYGILVKRQNGDDINPNEIKDIQTAFNEIYKSFGNRSEMSKKYGLKISHAGEKHMHARKAIGLFIPAYNAIGVTFAESTQGKLTLAHEFAHFMDYYLGKQEGAWYQTDIKGSTANKIANKFRNNMSDKNTAPDYWSRTCECFARALETYHAHKTGEEKIYDDSQYMVKSEIFKEKIMPLIDEFFKENDKLLKSFFSENLFFKAVQHER